MANIFALGLELKKILEIIEENDGEITPEIEENLDITSQNFKDKVEAYCQVISMYDSDIDCCKNEKNRINSIQNVKKNTLERIKKRLLQAVEQFGEIGKKGNRTVETPTRKLFTKETTSIEENETRKNELVEYIVQYITDLQKEGILELGNELDINGLLSSINAIAKADYEMSNECGISPLEEFVPYTVADLKAITLTCSFEKPLCSILTNNYDLGYFIASNPYLTNISSNIDKSMVKALKNADLTVTVANEIKKTSLTIK